MALVLEGIAGTLRQGQSVSRPDLQVAAHTSEMLWNAGPKSEPNRAADFAHAHAEFAVVIEPCAQGMPREVNIAGRSANRMAAQLRFMGELSQRVQPTLEAPAKACEAIANLAQKYARNASRTRQP
jgi:hypothetical protein